jgi:N6-adenosine-specific RNA methylase IME4
MTVEHKSSDPVSYRCIVADPPWRVATGRAMSNYSNQVLDGQHQMWVGTEDSSARPLAYPSMSVEEISALPVQQLAARDCHLYLWTINAYLRNAFDVLQAWGFKYSTTLVWAKNPLGGGLGGCYGLATEYCLFAHRGTVGAENRIGRNWWNWRRPYNERGKGKHSSKPQEFYEMVEGMSPGPRLEMFARAPREHWAVWGNEVNSDVQLTA